MRRAIHRTRQWLLARQQADGSWCAELEGDTILESETILLLAFLGHEDSELARRCAAYLVEKQLPEGGWAMYPGGGVEISGSVKAYFALKLTGHDPSAEYMQRARAAILAHGGADAVNSFTRFYLALLGQISYEQCPAVPPEIVLLPKWFPVNLYAVSSWSRTIIVPLSIISALRPVRRLEPRLGIRELFLREPENWPPLRCPGLTGGTGLLSWDRFFRTIDRLLKWCQRRRLLAAAAEGPGRGRALDDHPLRPQRRAGRDLSADRLEHRRAEVPGLSRRQPRGAILSPSSCSDLLSGRPEDRHDAACSPASRPSGTRRSRCGRWPQSGVRPENPAMREARPLAAGAADPPAGRLGRDGRCRAGRMVLRIRQRLLSRLRRHGDGADGVADAVCRPVPRLARRCRPSCDSAARGRPKRRKKPSSAIAALDDTVAAIDRGLRWLLAMQNRDGGWAAFDRNNDREFLCHVPFADHNAMIDPSTPDLTGRVLEALGQLGRRLGDPAVDRAVAYVRRTQNADGSWFGRWGVNYIYGTWQSLIGLAAVGVPTDDPAIVAGANWLLVHQQACGGWGESPDSYEFPHLRGQGPPTASQTAWALMGLLAAGLARPSGRRPRRPLPAADAERRRHVGRARVHRHRLPPGVLPAIPLLSDLLPAAGPFAMGRGGQSGAKRSAIGDQRSASSDRQADCRPDGSASRH